MQESVCISTSYLWPAVLCIRELCDIHVHVPTPLHREKVTCISKSTRWFNKSPSGISSVLNAWSLKIFSNHPLFFKQYLSKDCWLEQFTYHIACLVIITSSRLWLNFVQKHVQHGSAHTHTHTRSILSPVHTNNHNKQTRFRPHPHTYCLYALFTQHAWVTCMSKSTLKGSKT